ncbi:hypothetical protein [Lactococcus garvieae]|uniref:hypothetical protein n=1 Tax=Lactococcus garvieae TaxID=1363 RepID=UPI00398F37B9
MVKIDSKKIIMDTQEYKDINYDNRELLFQNTIDHFVNNRSLTDISQQILLIKKEIVGKTEKYKFDTNNYGDQDVSDFIILVGYFWKSIFKRYKITKPSRQIIFLKNWCNYSYENVAQMCKPLSIQEIKKQSTDNQITLLLHYMAFYGLWYNFKKWDDSIWEIINKLSPTEFIDFWISQSMLHVTTLSGKSITYSVSDWTPLNPNTLEDVEFAKKYIIKHKERLEYNNAYLKVNNKTNQIQYIKA